MFSRRSRMLYRYRHTDIIDTHRHVFWVTIPLHRIHLRVYVFFDRNEARYVLTSHIGCTLLGQHETTAFLLSRTVERHSRGLSHLAPPCTRGTREAKKSSVRAFLYYLWYPLSSEIVSARRELRADVLASDCVTMNYQNHTHT